MVIGFIFLLVAASSLGAVILTRQWVLEHRGVDLDESSMEAEDLNRFSNPQKIALAAMLVPLVIFLIVSVAYILTV